MPKGLAAPLLLLTLLAACQPPAADNYVERGDAPEAPHKVSEPLDSPDVEGALWVEVPDQDRLIYGKPGAAPLFAIACVDAIGEAQLRVTRYAPADADSKAFLALVGNGHIARLKVDATKSGEAFLWQGETPLSNDRLDVLTGARAVEATVPGAGTLKLNGSHLPGQLIERCRSAARKASSD